MDASQYASELSQHVAGYRSWNLEDDSRDYRHRPSRGDPAGVAVLRMGHSPRFSDVYEEDGPPPPRRQRSGRRRVNMQDALLAVPRGIVGALGSLATHMRSMVVVAVLALTVFMLYPPLRELYIANRRIDTLQVTYDQLLEENQAIRQQLEVLQTREGIENEARARGYVEAGETKVIVEGLPEDETPQGGVPIMTEVEVPDNRPWPQVLLDRLFGYTPGD